MDKFSQQNSFDVVFLFHNQCWIFWNKYQVFFFSASYNLMTAKLLWQCPFKHYNVSFAAIFHTCLYEQHGDHPHQPLVIPLCWRCSDCRRVQKVKVNQTWYSSMQDKFAQELLIYMYRIGFLAHNTCGWNSDSTLWMLSLGSFDQSWGSKRKGIASKINKIEF